MPKGLRRISGALVALIPFVALPIASASYPGKDGRIAFVTERDGDPDIYTMNADATGAVDISRNSVADLTPAWSPDGSMIAFASDRANPGYPTNGHLDIFVMRADGTGVRRFTFVAGDDSSPAWSPDGTEIAFVTGSASCGDCVVAVKGLDGTRYRRFPIGGAISGISWSPDGSSIAVGDWCRSCTDYQLFRFDPESGATTQLTNNTELQTLPNWNTGGTSLVYAHGDRSVDPPPDGSFGIWQINVEGSDPHPLLAGNLDANFPAPSPNGMEIAFSEQDCGFGGETSTRTSA